MSYWTHIKGSIDVDSINTEGIIKFTGTEKVKDVKFKNSTVCIIHNVTGRPMEKGESLPILLEKQVQSSVLMEDSIRYMAEEGVDTIIEIGPGNTISRFVKKTAPDITVMSIDTVDDYKKVVETLGGKYVK